MFLCYNTILPPLYIGNARFRVSLNDILWKIISMKSKTKNQIPKFDNSLNL